MIPLRFEMVLWRAKHDKRSEAGRISRLVAFAINIIVVKRVGITRTFTLTGGNARNVGIRVLLLCFPIIVGFYHAS